MEDHVDRRLTTTPLATSMDDPGTSQIAASWFTALLRAEGRDAAAAHANLLGWILALPEGLDPAAAASDVLAYQAHHPQPALSNALVALLRTVAASPIVRLTRRSAGRRRHLH
jgi:hypothetical protein